jgi:actin
MLRHSLCLCLFLNQNFRLWTLYNNFYTREQQEQRMDDANFQAVVLDAGSGVFKAGYAGHEYPTKSFQTVVGLPHLYNEKDIQTRRSQHLKKLKGTILATGEEYLVGEDALKNRHNHTLSYPIERGNVVDWEKMEFIYEHALLDLLNVEPEETLFLITECPYTATKTREQTAEFLFEVFQVPGLHTMPQSVLSLFSTGRTTGLVIDSGDAVTHACPVYDGFLLTHCIERLELGGRDVTNYLQRLLMKRGLNFESSAEHHFVRELKEDDKTGCIQVNVDPTVTLEHLTAVSLSNEQEKQFEVDFVLPDGQPVKIGRERFQCTEMLFHPFMNGKEAVGICDMTWNSLNACERDVKKDMYSNVVLVGGNTQFKGFKERITQDLNQLASGNGVYKTFKVAADPLRQFSSWAGGSIMASLSTFPDFVVTIDDWDDYGPSVLWRK